jgi:hypothetical protein
MENTENTNLNNKAKNTKPDANREANKLTRLMTMLAPASSERPIAWSDDVWDATNIGDDLAKVMGGAGQYSQHDINEALAANGGNGGGAANVNYTYHEGENEEDKSVFNQKTVKGLNTANGVVKVPSFYYCKITDNYTQGVNTSFAVIELNTDGKMVGDCPIVQVTHKTVENNEAKYSVVYCDYSINIETKRLTITWNSRINVDENEPLYVSIIG